MNFVDFARAHGLRMDYPVEGRWVAVPTEDHPHKKNGRYKFMGDIGWVQNWATMTSPEMWKSNVARPAFQKNRPIQFIGHERIRAAEKAAEKARRIVSEAKPDLHPYLSAKGFPDTDGLVWDTGDARLLVIAMWLDGKLVGCQLIDKEGNKKFLSGQICKGATHRIGMGGISLFCEGFATALSVQQSMRFLKIQYNINVAFSAGNLAHVAKSGIVVADNDKAGIDAAEKTGLPYWKSDKEGEDFNDYSKRVGTFASAMSLKPFLMKSRAA